MLRDSGLLESSSEFHVGINGGEESIDYSQLVIPSKAKVFFNGLHSKSEILTLVQLQYWLPGHQNWNVLYFHSKGATKGQNKMVSRWRDRMMFYNVVEWKKCVSDLEVGFDSVGCHWLDSKNQRSMPPGQAIWGGNFWWAKAAFLMTLPDLTKTARARISGLESMAGRYEAETWIGSGRRKPKVRDYHPGWPHLC